MALSWNEKVDYAYKWTEYLLNIPTTIRKPILSKFNLSYEDFFEVRNACLLYLYTYENMSCEEINQKYKEFFVNRSGTMLTARSIRRVVTLYGMERSHREAMKHRIKQGRMDYDLRVTDYAKRKTDYKNRKRYKEYTKYGTGLEQAVKSKNMTGKDIAKSLS